MSVNLTEHTTAVCTGTGKGSVYIYMFYYRLHTVVLEAYLCSNHTRAVTVGYRHILEADVAKVTVQYAKEAVVRRCCVASEITDGVPLSVEVDGKHSIIADGLPS